MRKIIFFLLLCTVFSSCRIIREHKVNRAVGIVLSDDNAREKVYQIQSGLHPVIPQEPIYIPGKDSIIEKPYPVDKVRDSLIYIECPTLNLDSLRKALTTTKLRVDTVKVADTSLLRLYNNAVFLNNFKDGQLLALTEQLSNSNKTINKQRWWIIGLSVLSGLLFVSLIYLIFKNVNNKSLRKE